MSTPQAGHGYRRDIDGLRALAILPILLLHCGVEQLRGGFVGVDIFFVISGYLITGILVRDIEQDRFSLIRFYRHRIVRILPALMAMMVITLAIGCFVLLPNALRDLGRSAAATSIFGSNIYFYFTSDYFAAASDSKPLIHTWSLAVEEQFYLAYPLLLLALRRLTRQQLVKVIGAIALVSFAAGGWLAFADASAGFFLLPARIWELALGALVALGAFPTLANPRLRQLLCAAALATIAASVVMIGSGWPFPVPFALPPALATAILIAYGETGATARFLSLAPLRWIGLISYSAYLWHRPIIAFHQINHGTDFTLSDTILLVAATLGAAALSYALVERPTRKHWRDGTDLYLHEMAVIWMLGLAATGLTIANRADLIRPLPPQLAKIASFQGWDTTPDGRAQFSTDRCFTLPTGKPFDPQCLVPEPNRRNILLMGDSHAAHYAQALRQALPDAHILQATAAGCRPLIEARGLRSCRAVIAQGFAAIDPNRTDTVVLSALWLDFEEGQLIDTIERLTRRGIKVIVFGSSVEYDNDLPLILVQAQQRPDPSLPNRLRRADRFETDRRLAPKIRAAGATYVSMIDLECPKGSCRLVMPDGAPMHFDHSHVTPSAARYLMDRVAAEHLRRQ
ncbi:acyltransferase [Sphingomonas sp. R647]|uniref:acyltransferase family protein n=1 Tax=Sphingomonas sp. R647 TaxID=2875233 RepID=UPI001CD231D3|nr:acyltransferase family protein [Sphingomonas sp. R647]MCA1196338.1 acyltransferase [Sphingomonas sp. R647]